LHWSLLAFRIDSLRSSYERKSMLRQRREKTRQALTGIHATPPKRISYQSTW
jgi:hypothetical protein